MSSVSGLNSVTDKIIGAAIDVHRQLGPGLLESTLKKTSIETVPAMVICHSEERLLATKNLGGDNAGFFARNNPRSE